MAIGRIRGSIPPSEAELRGCAELYQRLAAVVADRGRASELLRLARFYAAKADALREREAQAERDD